MKTKKFLLLIAAAAVLAALFCACARTETPVDSDNEPTLPTRPSETPTEPEDSPVLPKNPLTGLDMRAQLEGMRPVAIMINNIKPALPQRGIGKADLVAELPTEGSTNRLLAVFYDYESAGDIGTVRSARDYFFEFAAPLDAVYLHYGGSPQAYSLLRTGVLTHFDGINGKVDRLLYWRDAERRKKNGSEHSVFTSGQRIKETLAEYGTTLTTKATAPFFNFSENAPEGTAASYIKIVQSSYITAEFSYDSATFGYKRSQYGKPHIDEADGSQIEVKNLFVLFAKVSAIPGDTEGRLKVTFDSGEGYFFSGGGAVPIKWTKSGRDAFFRFTTESGTTLEVPAGNVWITVLSTSKKDKLSFE